MYHERWRAKRDDLTKAHQAAHGIVGDGIHVRGSMLFSGADMRSTDFSVMTTTGGGTSPPCATAIGHTRRTARTSGCCSAGTVNRCLDLPVHDVCDDTVLAYSIVADGKVPKSIMRCSMGACLAIP